jgi:hypothetical protein
VMVMMMMIVVKVMMISKAICTMPYVDEIR